MRRAAFFLFALALSGSAGAETFRRIRNPFTGQPDFYTVLSSITIPSGSTNYVQVTNTLQSGATFFVSSGTVSGPLTVTTLSASSGTVTILNSTTGTITTANISSGTVSWLISSTATISSGTVTTLNSTTASLSSATVTNFTATASTATRFNSPRSDITTITGSSVTYTNGTVTTFIAGTSNLSGSTTLGTSTANVVTVNAFFTLLSNAAPQANLTPSATGQIIINTGATPDELCFSTGTAAASWVSVSTPTRTCAN